MKKALSIFLVLMLSFALLVGCADEAAQTEEEQEPNPAEDVEQTPAEDTGFAKIGLGTKTSIAKSRDAADGVQAQAQVDTTIAAVAFDEDGKVVNVTIDVAQTRVLYDKDLKVASDVKGEFKTKAELADDYGMIKASGIGKEWYQQIAELEKWMIGKTVEEIKAMDTYEKDPTHLFVPNVPELTSMVTITVESYIDAVEEAYNTAFEIPAGAVTLGLGTEVSIAKSRGLDAAANVTPRAQVDTTIAVTAFDADGKVVRTIVDNAQTRVEFDADGKVTTDKSGEFLTKVELADNYGMVAASGIGKEWYQQMAEFEKWMAGKTVGEIQALKTYEKDPTHLFVPDVPELTSHVTITVESYIAVVAESYQNAK